VLGLLVGKRYIALSFNNWVQGENSQERLIGKTAGVFPDVRLKPGKWYGQNYDGGGLDHQSIELLLKLTSGDAASFGRKYIGAWTGIVPIKIAMASNQVPNFNDPVLPTRFVKLLFEQSFLDREDVNLKLKLAGETPRHRPTLHGSLLASLRPWPVNPTGFRPEAQGPGRRRSQPNRSVCP